MRLSARRTTPPLRPPAAGRPSPAPGTRPCAARSWLKTTNLLQHLRKGRGPRSPWLLKLLAKKEPKEVAVALANKIARIAWRMMVSGEDYDPSGLMRKLPQRPPRPPITQPSLGDAGTCKTRMRWCDRSIQAREPLRGTHRGFNPASMSGTRAAGRPSLASDLNRSDRTYGRKRSDPLQPSLHTCKQGPSTYGSPAFRRKGGSSGG